MAPSRLIYQDWIVNLGFDPAGSWQQAAVKSKQNPTLVKAVSEALLLLKNDEADFIRSFYYQGMTYPQISRQTGRAIYRLEALHRRALIKLRHTLSSSLGVCGSANLSMKDSCPLCSHTQRIEIDALITSKKPQETWHRTIKTLKEKYGLFIKTPQRLIGHRKYHILGREKKDGRIEKTAG